MSENLKKKLKKDPYYFKMIDHSYKNRSFVSELLGEKIDITPYLNDSLLYEEVVIEKAILLNPENIKFFPNASWKWQELAIKNNIACINNIIPYRRSINDNEKVIKYFKDAFYEKDLNFEKEILENELLMVNISTNWLLKGKFLKYVMTDDIQNLQKICPVEIEYPYIRDMVKLQNGFDLTDINNVEKYQKKVNDLYIPKYTALFKNLEKKEAKEFIFNMLPKDKTLIGLAFDLQGIFKNKGLKNILIQDTELIEWFLEIDGQILKYLEEFQSNRLMIKKAILNTEKAFHLINNDLKNDISFLKELITINEDVFLETDNNSFELAEFLVNEIDPKYIKSIPASFVSNKKLLFKFLEYNKLEGMTIDLKNYKELYTEDKHIRMLLKTNGQYFWSMPDKIRENKEYLILALESEPNIIIKERLSDKFLEDEDIARLAMRCGVVSHFLNRIDLDKILPKELEGLTLIGLESFSSRFLNNDKFMKEAIQVNKSNIAISPSDFLKEEALKELCVIDFCNLIKFQKYQLWQEEFPDDILIDILEKSFNCKLELTNNNVEFSRMIINQNLSKELLELNNPKIGPDSDEINFYFSLLKRVPSIYEWFSKEIRNNKKIALKAIQLEFKNINFVSRELRESNREVALSILNSSLDRNKKLNEDELSSLKGTSFEEILCNYAKEYDHNLLKVLILHNPNKKNRIKYLSLDHKIIIKSIVKIKQLPIEELEHLLFTLKDDFINYLIFNFQKNASVIFKDEMYKSEFFFGIEGAVSKFTLLSPSKSDYVNHFIINEKFPTLSEMAIFNIDVSKKQVFNYTYLTPYKKNKTFEEIKRLSIPIDKNFIIKLIHESNLKSFDAFIEKEFPFLDADINSENEYIYEICECISRVIKRARVHYRKPFEEKMKFLSFIPEEFKSNTEIIMEYIRYGGSNLTYFNVSITEIVSGFIINSSSNEDKFKSSILESKFKSESDKKIEFLEIINSVFRFSNLIDIDILEKELEKNREKIENYLKKPILKDELFYIMEFLMLEESVSEKELFWTLERNFKAFLNYIRTYLLENSYPDENNNKILIKKLFPNLNLEGQVNFFKKCKTEFKNQLNIGDDVIEELERLILSAFKIKQQKGINGIFKVNEADKNAKEYNLHYKNQIYPIMTSFLPAKSRKGKTYSHFCKCIDILVTNKTISYREIRDNYPKRDNFPDIYRKYILKRFEYFSIEFNNIFMKEKYELYFDPNNKKELLKLIETN